MRNIALPCGLVPFFAAEAFHPPPRHVPSRGAPPRGREASASAVTRAMTDGIDDDKTSTSKDIMTWFLEEPESPIFMAMVKNLSPNQWDPIKYQLDRVPAFYCGTAGAPPADLPFPCFLDVDDAEAHLKSLDGGEAGRGFGEKGGEKEERDAPKLDVIPMLLGDAYENAAVGHSVLRASTKQSPADAPPSNADDASVPVFGIKTLVQTGVDDEGAPAIQVGLTDRLYFEEAQARGILAQVKEQYDSEEETFELFEVSLTKTIEYMLLDAEMQFDYVPPTSSLEYLAAKTDTTLD